MRVELLFADGDPAAMTARQNLVEVLTEDAFETPIQMIAVASADDAELLGMPTIVVVGRGKSELDAYVAKLAEMEKRVIKDEPTPEKGFYYRSDHFSFAKLGVPMFNFGSGDDLVEGGVEAGKKAAEDYEKNRYHAPADEYAAIKNWDGMLADLKLYYAAGRMLASTTAWQNWNEGDEFLATRDKSRPAK